MFILLLALIFGIAVGIFAIASLQKGKEKGDKRKFVRIIKFIVLLEAVIFVAVFVVVFLRTLIM